MQRSVSFFQTSFKHNNSSLLLVFLVFSESFYRLNWSCSKVLVPGYYSRIIYVYIFIDLINHPSKSWQLRLLLSQFRHETLISPRDYRTVDMSPLVNFWKYLFQWSLQCFLPESPTLPLILYSPRIELYKNFHPPSWQQQSLNPYYLLIDSWSNCDYAFFNHRLHLKRIIPAS